MHLKCHPGLRRRKQHHLIHSEQKKVQFVLLYFPEVCVNIMRAPGLRFVVMNALCTTVHINLGLVLGLPVAAVFFSWRCAPVDAPSAQA